MKKFLIVGFAAAALGLAACGATASLNGAVASLGSSADLQVHVTMSASGAGTASEQPVLSALSLDVDYSNPSGSPTPASSPRETTRSSGSSG